MYKWGASWVYKLSGAAARTGNFKEKGILKYYKNRDYGDWLSINKIWNWIETIIICSV